MKLFVFQFICQARLGLPIVIQCRTLREIKRFVLGVLHSGFLWNLCVKKQLRWLMYANFNCELKPENTGFIWLKAEVITESQNGCYARGRIRMDMRILVWLSMHNMSILFPQAKEQVFFYNWPSASNYHDWLIQPFLEHQVICTRTRWLSLTGLDL
jgi:hypothetical protein